MEFPGNTVTAGAVLAGGMNSRLPFLKGFIRIDDGVIIERTVGIFRSRFSRVFINANRPAMYLQFGCPVVPDSLPSRGPMSGIHAVLRAAGQGSVFIAACDMPFICGELVDLIVKRHESGTSNATVAVFPVKPQPLFGAYSTRVIPALEAGVLQNRNAMLRFLDEIGAEHLTEQEVMTADPDGRSFFNINTTDDYEAFRTIMAEAGSQSIHEATGASAE